MSENDKLADTDKFLRHAEVSFKGGRYAEAEECLNRVISLEPGHLAASQYLGMLAAQRGDYVRAVKLFTTAIRGSPRDHHLGNNLALALQHSGRLEEALAEFQRVIELAPDFTTARFNKCLLLRGMGRLEAALDDATWMERRLSKIPEVHLTKGVILKEMGCLEGALNSCGRAIDLQPNFSDAHLNRGALLKEMGRLEEALCACDEAVRLQPGSAESHMNRGGVLRDLGKLNDALNACERAISLKTDLTMAHINRGLVLRDLGQLDAARAAFQRAIKLEPESDEAHTNLALLLLLKGELHQGWQEYAWRLRDAAFVPDQRDMQIPLWDGSSLQGKTLLLQAEQGIGDEIMFASCIPDVVAGTGGLVVECDRRLVPLIKRSFPQADCRARKQGAQFHGELWSPEDYRLWAGSLPRFFRNNTTDFPMHDGYLVADPLLAEKWAARLDAAGKGPRIGLSWRGGKTEEGRRKRSIPLMQWQPVGDLRHALLVNLQYGASADEISEAGEWMSGSLHSWDEIDPLNELEEFAALISQLDLVISIDNSTVHLAGALGTPTWVLLPVSPDWRWMRENERTPWYPAVRLYRQTDYGVWDDVFRKLQLDLRAKFVSTSVDMGVFPPLMVSACRCAVPPLVNFSLVCCVIITPRITSDPCR